MEPLVELKCCWILHEWLCHLAVEVVMVEIAVGLELQLWFLQLFAVVVASY